MSNDPADQIDSLNRADTYWVSEVMCAILATAQQTMPDDDVIEPPPSPHGFLVFTVVPISRSSGAHCI